MNNHSLEKAQELTSRMHKQRLEEQKRVGISANEANKCDRTQLTVTASLRQARKRAGERASKLRR